MSYESQVLQIKDKLASSSGVLIAISTQLNEDKLGAALALYLALKEAGKQVSIVTAGTPKVSHSNLFGIGDITDRLPQGKGGNLTLTLEGVVDAQGKVPSLEKLDWFPNGFDLNLVFHVVPGQNFEPINIRSSYDQANFDLIFVFGARYLDDLGAIYKQNNQAFSGVTVVNVDVSQNNTNFGTINLVDQGGTSMSEMVFQVLNGLGLPVNADIASNILAGIYKVTENLTKNVQANTFLAVGQAMQVGGKLPQAMQGNPRGTFDAKPFMNQPQRSEQQQQQQPQRSNNPSNQGNRNNPQRTQNIQSTQPPVAQRDTVEPHNPITPHVEESTQPQRVDTASFAPIPTQPEPQPVEPEPQPQETEQARDEEPLPADFQHPLDVNPPAEDQTPDVQTFQVQDETPSGEQVTSGNPENPAPDWLAPKIFKGGSLG